jgi:hypothetical protein
LNAFEPGDIFVTATILQKGARFPTGQGRIRHYDRNWNLKGERDTGRTGLISALVLDSSGTLHIMDPQARAVDHIGAVTMPNLPQRGYGSMIVRADGSYMMGEHLVGDIPGFNGDGKVYRVDASGSVLQTWGTETNGGMGGFLGVTHMALSPDGNTLYHVSETGPHVYAHDLVSDRRLGAIYTRQDPPLMVFGLACLPDGDLLVATGGGVRRLSPDGTVKRDYVLPEGRGWAVIVLRENAESFWALDFFGGRVALIATETGDVVFEKDLGLPKALTGIAEVPMR